MPYQVAPGFDNSGALADLAPQPASPQALQHPALVVAGDGTSSFQGFDFMDLIWTVTTRTEYNTIRTAFGLSDVIASAPVTVRILLPGDTFANRNAQATQVGRNSRAIAFWRNITIRLVHIQATA